MALCIFPRRHRHVERFNTASRCADSSSSSWVALPLKLEPPVNVAEVGALSVLRNLECSRVPDGAGVGQLGERATTACARSCRYPLVSCAISMSCKKSARSTGVSSESQATSRGCSNPPERPAHMTRVVRIARRWLLRTRMRRRQRRLGHASAASLHGFVADNVRARGGRGQPRLAEFPRDRGARLRPRAPQSAHRLRSWRRYGRVPARGAPGRLPRQTLDARPSPGPLGRGTSAELRERVRPPLQPEHSPSPGPVFSRTRELAVGHDPVRYRHSSPTPRRRRCHRYRHAGEGTRRASIGRGRTGRGGQRAEQGSSGQMNIPRSIDR